MRRASRLTASTLLAVLLATVLAPSFSWEASAGQTAHGHDVVVLADSQGVDGHDHPDENANTNTDPGIKGSHQHHGCAGHMFGHLFVAVYEVAAPAFFESGDVIAAGPQRGLITQFPKRLDRPPHAPDLA